LDAVSDVATLRQGVASNTAASRRLITDFGNPSLQPLETSRTGFYTVVAAQFFSSLADSALFFAALQMLRDLNSPVWMTPILKQCFVLSYVLLAPFVGAFADSMPKGRVMLVSNAVKIVGCAMMLFAVHPLLAYAIVGLGAAAYAPAKYGILTELLPPKALVAANAWIEATTIASIVLGAALSAMLLNGRMVTHLLSIGVPYVDTGPQAAICVIGVAYALAALFNVYIPRTGVAHRSPSANPVAAIREFGECCAMLWRDKLGQITLATTTLLWGTAATLQLIVIDWAATHLCYDLPRASYLTGVVAVGIGMGAVAAARFVSIKSAVKVLPVGVLLGVAVMLMATTHLLTPSLLLLTLIGGMAGFFVVPMNALLQLRGHQLMGAGHSIAVQNFCENIGILVVLSLYAVLMYANLSINTVIVLFGAFVSGSIALVTWRHRCNLSATRLGTAVQIDAGSSG
jgi:MFS transporter, LPLT family, lysophospholipid transporter